MSEPNGHIQDETERRVAALFEKAEFWADLAGTKRRMLQSLQQDAAAHPVRPRSVAWFPFLARENLAFTLSFAVVLIALGIFLFAPAASLGTYRGALAVYHPLSGQWEVARAGEIPADRLLRAESEEVSLTLMDGSSITLSPDSFIEVSKTGIDLHRGRIIADVKPQAVGHPFRIQTPTAKIKVLGTRFSVTVE